MHLGFGLPMAGAWATPQNQLRVARAAEDLGYHSLWVFQRFLEPNFQPVPPTIDRVLAQMEAFAPHEPPN